MVIAKKVTAKKVATKRAATKKPRTSSAAKSVSKPRAKRPAAGSRTPHNSKTAVIVANSSGRPVKTDAFDKFFEWLEQRTQKIRAEDLEGLMRRAMEIRLNSRGPAAFGYYFGTGKRILGYARDYWKGDHREMPWYSITAAVVGTLYMLSPIDLVPDFVPVLGALDDAAVAAACLALIERDLAAREARAGGSKPGN